MDSIERIKLFIGSQKPLQLVSDLDFWTTLYQKLSVVEGQYSRGLTDVIEFFDERMKPLIDDINGDSKIRASNGKNEFLYDVLELRGALDSKFVAAAMNCELFAKDASALKGFKNDDKNMCIEMKHRRKAFKDLHKTYTKYKSVTEERKFRYQSAALEVEKLEIDLLHERRESFLREMNREAARLQRRAERDELRYKVAVTKAEEKFDLLKAAASQYENVFMNQETARADLIVGTLADGGQKFGIGICEDRKTLFDHVDVQALCSEACMYGTYQVHTFEVFSKSLLTQLQNKASEARKSRKQTKSSASKKQAEECQVKSDDGKKMRVRRKKKCNSASVKESHHMDSRDTHDKGCVQDDVHRRRGHDAVTPDRQRRRCI